MDPILSDPKIPVLPFTSRPSASAPARPAAPLISDQLRRPVLVGLVSVLPLALLLWSGLYDYSIIGSDLSPSDRTWSLVNGAVLLVAITLAAVVTLRGLGVPRILSTGETVATLLVSITAMVVGLTFTEWVLPWTVPEWMVSRDELLYRSFCLGMPGAFYALLLLFSGPAKRHVGYEFGKAIVIVVACLGGLFLLGQALSFLARYLPSYRLPEWASVGLVFFVLFGTGTLLSGAVIRLTLLAYTSVRRLPFHTQQGFMFLIGIVGPLAGLWLNRNLPFPTDLQAPIVYLLSVVNGLLLMLPAVRSIF